MKKNSPIGFFDSGVGGLSVYSAFKQLLSNEDTIYFGDLLNLPYGDKTQDELIGFATKILDFFEKKNVKAVVIACNTSSALAYESVKGNYDFKIYPIIQSCAEAISSLNLTRVGVFATKGTVESGVYSNELKKYNSFTKVKEIACPNWVSIVESGVLNTAAILGTEVFPDELIDVKSHLDEMMEFNPEKIILGCTHYPFLIPFLSRFAPIEKFIDPAKIFVDYIRKDLAVYNLLNDSDYEGLEKFYVSAYPELFLSNAQMFYNVGKLPDVVDFTSV